MRRAQKTSLTLARRDARERPARARYKPRKGSPEGELSMVYVLDKRKRPLNPCTEKRARLLLERGRAVVHKLAPFTIRLKDRLVEKSGPLRLKLDPGYEITGFGILRENKVVLLGEIRHKPGVKDAIDARRDQRRSRRNRKTRYREPRFDNRGPAKCAACGKNARRAAAGTVGPAKKRKTSPTTATGRRGCPRPWRRG